MENHVLVLNSSYVPINTVSWQKAITWVVSGRAVIEDVYEGLFLHSPSKKIPMPSIIRFISKVASYFRKGIKFSRKNIWIRDKGVCQYCGKKVSLSDFTFDHVIPKHLGGRTVWDNIVVACYECNQKKEGRTPEQAHMHLIQKPYKPKQLSGAEVFDLCYSFIPESWKDYLK